MMARMPERLVGARRDNSPCICGAVKYVFSFRRMEWVATSTNVRVLTPLKAAAKGGMRVCYDVEEVEEDGSRTPCVAKLFLRNISDVVEKDYFSEGKAQCMCEQFANNFNKATFTGIERPHVSFLQCQVLRIPKQNIPAEHRDAQHGFFSYKTTDTREVMFVMEPRLHGHFTKYNSNFGETYEGDKHFKTPSQIQQRTRMFLIAEAFLTSLLPRAAAPCCCVTFRASMISSRTHKSIPKTAKGWVWATWGTRASKSMYCGMNAMNFVGLLH
ncbi:putative myosin heavy chain kinase A [Trypanosoma cruzi]|uniref:Putative myosin heavy chain kinase A n=1 Tax=Trypanosoma cruzi TaxID=5693 RepID=A0A2V2VKW1_TRYCR|nr:putative myosin heavy chain kinase A [Trypanosoma cruzi]